MDEQALRATFERALKNLAMDKLSETGSYIYSEAEWAYRGWLACYQHLAPMVEDGERYVWLRDQPIVLLQEFATLASGNWDKAIDAAREQEKKNAQE